MLIYISGPMTGLQDFNYPHFNRVAAELRSQDHDVINPASCFEVSWLESILRDIELVAQADAIFLLRGWERSFGARIEKLVAEKFDLEILYEGR